MPVLTRLDAVMVRVSSLDEGLRFYEGALGHRLLWRHDAIGQAGLACPDSETEIVLSTGHDYHPVWLVADLAAALATIEGGAGRVTSAPEQVPVGWVAVAQDPFGNRLVLIELTGRYEVSGSGKVESVSPAQG